MKVLTLKSGTHFFATQRFVALALLEEQQETAETAADQSLIDQYVAPQFEGLAPDQAVLIEFVDYQCGYCRRAHGEVEALLGTEPEIARRIVQLPILGEVSTAVAEIALAIRADQGDEAYVAAHDVFMGGDARYAQRPMLYVEEAGFDVAAIQQLTQSDAVQFELSQTRELARMLGVSGTPGFVTRTNIIRGYADAVLLSEAVFQFEAQE